MFAYADDSWWDTERFAQVRKHQTTHEVNFVAQVMSNYDPDVAPPGKQLLVVGTNCSCDPQAVAETEMLMDKCDELLFQLLPEVVPVLEEKKRVGQDRVSALFRDSVLPGQGGSWGGVALAVGQSGRKRPSSVSPINGLFYVGLAVGGGQMGIHLSSGSAMDVANIVDRYHKRSFLRGA
jgi:phytoene dehydrogenase-like protein